MLRLDDKSLVAHTPWPALIDALAEMFVSEVIEPVRHHHGVEVPGEAEATLLLMPAWITGRYLGVKQVMVVPGNNARGLPAISGSYLLSDATTGTPLAEMHAPTLTARRTAAASALASRFLSRQNARHLLMLGAGKLGHTLVEAHCAVRPIDTVSVWSRTSESADQLVAHCQQLGLLAERCSDSLATIAHEADIISCATLATEPLIRGEWLKAGVHLDLVGAFRPTMREVDSTAVKRAEVFVDTRAGALSEAGDLVQARAEGAFADDEVVASLSELCASQLRQQQQQQSGELVIGRAALGEQAITLFKSVGAAREDLACAILAFESAR